MTHVPWCSARSPRSNGRLTSGGRRACWGRCMYVPQETMPTVRATAVRVKVVRRECNHGWMSQLETAAQRPLRRMFQDPSWTLTHEEVRTLIRWTAKTALMNEYSAEGGPSVLTQEMLDAVRDDQELPGTWHIGLARIRQSLHFAMSSTPLIANLYPTGPDAEHSTPTHYYPYAIQHLVAAWKILFIVRYSPYQEIAPASLWHDFKRYPRGNPIRLGADLGMRKTRTKHLPDFVPRNWEDLTFYWGRASHRRDAFTCVRLKEYADPVIVTHDMLKSREGEGAWGPL